MADDVDPRGCDPGPGDIDLAGIVGGGPGSAAGERLCIDLRDEDMSGVSENLSDEGVCCSSYAIIPCLADGLTIAWTCVAEWSGLCTGLGGVEDVECNRSLTFLLDTKALPNWI